MYKVCALWVPLELVPEMWKRIVAVQIFLAHYEKDGTKFLEQVVTVMNREFIMGLSKQKLEFRLENEGWTITEKIQGGVLAGKVMLTAFWDY